MKKRMKSLILGLILFCAPFAAFAEEHHHPPQDVEIHEKFYSTWNRPDYRTDSGERFTSCCNKHDCFPAEIKVSKGKFSFRKEGTLGGYTPIPDALMEHNQPDPRESPDGRSHVCANGTYVYCATLGNGM